MENTNFLCPYSLTSHLETPPPLSYISTWPLSSLTCLSVLFLCRTAVVSTHFSLLGFILPISYLINCPEVQIWLGYFAAQKTLMAYFQLNSKSLTFWVDLQNSLWPDSIVRPKHFQPPFPNFIYLFPLLLPNFASLH